MKLLVIFLFLICTHCLLSQHTNERILDGSEAPLNAFPWMVSVHFNLLNSSKIGCGGAILSNIFIITAASCFHDYTEYSQYTIKAGIHNIINENETTGQNRSVFQIIMHPNYSPEDFINDLALVRVTPPFDFNSLSVSNISLSSLTSVKYMNLITIGWGIFNQSNLNVSTTNLQQVIVQENVECTENKAMNSTTQICASGTCLGDSGGPLMIFSNDSQRFELVAVTSFRNACTTEGLFTRIVPFADWILSTLKNPPPLPTTTTTTTTTGVPIRFECNTNYSCGCSSIPVIFHDGFSSSVRSHNQGRIVGGETAQPHSWPWIVSIRLFNTYTCGRTLINDEWVLTAAHCLLGTEFVTIHIGDHDGTLPSPQIRTIVREIEHPDYVPAPRYINDIALLRLSSPVNFTTPDDHVGITCLPPQSSDLNYPEVGTPLSVIGWGRLFQGGPLSPQLQQVRVMALANDDWRCINASYNKQRQFCAMVDGGGKDACQGDSGGPIHQWLDDHWEQVGIVSYGRGCALVIHPGVYTRLSFYYDWIQESIKDVNITSTTTTAAVTSIATMCKFNIFYSLIIYVILRFFRTD